MREIILTKGKSAIVDDSDYQWLSQWKWTYHNQGYAYRGMGGRKNRKCILMHRLIMNTPDGMDTDHINMNKLDNRRVNLRICDRSLNLANQGGRLGSSLYRGVHYSKKQKAWLSQIKDNGRTKHIGSFKNEREAAKAYNLAATRKYGNNHIYLNNVET